MKHLPTRTAEKAYDVLTRFAEASPDYYERESFVYHFGVVSGTSNRYRLSCMDGGVRYFICKENGEFWVDGTSVGKANAILRKIAKEPDPA